MRLSIFWRLTLGSLAIIALLAAVSIYALTQLRYLTTANETLAVSDYPAVETARRLSASLINQLRSEKKYLAVGEIQFSLEFDEEAGDFRDTLAALVEAERVGEARMLLVRTQRQHEQY